MYKVFKQNDFDFSLISEPPVIYISDIDETYLRTDFKTLKGLLMTAFQFAIDKLIYPDMSLFYKTVKKDPAVALYFISSSPVELRGVLQRKFLIEEVPYDGLILRDVVHLLLSGHWREIRNHFGFKLFAILNLLDDIPRESTIVLIGDDTETDSDIYRTVKGVVDGSLDLYDLEGELLRRKIHRDQIPQILRQSEGMSEKALRVAAIFIRQTGSGKAPVSATDIVPFTHPREMMDVLCQRKVVSPELHTCFSSHIQK